MAQNKFKCKPVLIDNTFHSLDYIYDNFIDCNSSVQILYDNYVIQNKLDEFCMKKCPKDCIKFDLNFKEVISRNR